MATKEKPHETLGDSQGRTRRRPTTRIEHSVKYRKDLLPAWYFTVGRDCADLTPALLVQDHSDRASNLAMWLLNIVAALAAVGLAVQLAGWMGW